MVKAYSSSTASIPSVSPVGSGNLIRQPKAATFPKGEG